MTTNRQRLDQQAKTDLRDWASRPEKFLRARGDARYWLRAQPTDGQAVGPRLRSPGAAVFKTQPDGLWVYFAAGDCADVVVVEACGSLQNLNDKRSRYMPSTHALLLEVKSLWLAGTIRIKNGAETRWRACGAFATAPARDLDWPVRHIRVLYALPLPIYKKARAQLVPGGHEFFCPLSSLGTISSAQFRKFITRMSPRQQFYSWQ